MFIVNSRKVNLKPLKKEIMHKILSDWDSNPAGAVVSRVDAEH